MKKIQCWLILISLCALMCAFTGCRAALRETPNIRTVNTRTALGACRSLGEIRAEGLVEQDVRENMQRQTQELGGNVLFVDFKRFFPQYNNLTEMTKPELVIEGEAFTCP
jgi:hypothetical protein